MLSRTCIRFLIGLHASLNILFMLSFNVIQSFRLSVHLFCNKRIGWCKLFWLHFEGRPRWDILENLNLTLLAKYYKVLQQVSPLPFQNSTMLSFSKKSFLNVYMIFYFFNQFISCYKNSDTSFSRQIHFVLTKIDLWKV